MIAGYRQSYKLLLAGYFAARLGGLIPILLGAGEGITKSPLFYGVYVTGTVLLFWGCWALARAKGYSGWYLLLAVAGLLGLIVLAVLPDRSPSEPDAGAPADSASEPGGTDASD